VPTSGLQFNQPPKNAAAYMATIHEKPSHSPINFPTLGMHRVYNSAFMNMMRDEENAKYLQ
jgi:hypothetical protein